MGGALSLRNRMAGASLRVLPGPLALDRLPGADLGDPLVDRDLQPLGGPHAVVEVGESDPEKPGSDSALDGAEIGFLVRGHEGERVPRQLGAGRAADAVDVVLGDVRDVEVDDVRERLDVDAARGDVGRDEDAEFSLLETGKGRGPL